jgi:hypothetical protein
MPSDLTDAQLRDLLKEGLSRRAIAQRTGIPRSTVQDRIKRLGLQVTPAAPAPQVTHAAPTTTVPPADPASTAVTFVAVPEMQELLSLVKDLHARVGALEQTRVAPALPASPTTTAPPVSPAAPVTTATPTPHAPPVAPAPPAVERKDVQQWTIRLSKALIDHLKAVAYERRMPPSQLVEELVWRAINDR